MTAGVQRAGAEEGVQTRNRDWDRRWARIRPWAPDVVGVLAVVAAAVAVLVPALAHGSSLGPFDLLSRYGLTQRPGVAIHNSQSTDQIAEMIPWSTVAWTQVHHGQLPLWNPYNGLGMPLAFNWQSATFSLPTLLGYLAPLRLAYTVQVMVTLALAGTGLYVLGRVLRLGVVACVMAAMVFELGGEMMGTLGWPISGVMAWTGWIFAALLLVVRGQRRGLAVVLLAVAEAGAVYAGQPDTLALFGVGIIVFVVALFALRARGSGSLRDTLRPLGDMALATVVGFALSAPLILPGLQLIEQSVFLHASRANTALSPSDVVNLVFQGFNGLAVAKSQWFAAGSSAYVGVIALVLALMGTGVRRRRPEVLAFAVMGAVMAVLVFVPEAATLVNGLPFRARWHLGLVVVTFAIAVLAGVGTDVLIRAPREWATRMWLGAGFGVTGLVVAALWLVGRGHLAPSAARLRSQSFIWPSLAILCGLVVVAALTRSSAQVPRPDAGGQARGGTGLLAASVLLAVETAFLVGVGAPLLSSSPTFLPSTPAVTSLQRAVGDSLVGFGVPSCELPPTLGILPEVNAAFRVHELSAYDPVTPRAYFKALHVGPGVPVSAFCPVVTTATEARRYGVAFVLEPRGAPGPVGAVYAEAVGSEDLYRVPGAAAATVTALGVGGRLPTSDAPGTPVAVTHPDPAAWDIVTRGHVAQELRLHLSDVPGWHASLDGKPLRLTRFGGIMLQATVPPGHHAIEVHYWPEAFTIGIALAAGGVLAVVAVLVLGWRRRPVRADTGVLPATE